MEDSHYTKPVNKGEIVIFRNRYDFALVKILEVAPRLETLNAKLHFQYE